ncbi:DUF1080 domain-containing protein [Alteromonadaceae bacterium BrNp21-10]|nr:DUF1080 domain-containing protein [Alteromonadaceae bacterium BrNp21-10]
MYKLFLLFFLTSLSSLSLANTAPWVSLFDGKTLSGWQANERPDSWKVLDGAIVTNGERSHLFYTGEVAQHNFKNFVFSAKVKAESGSNSGIYIHTQLSDDHWPSKGYELQVYNARPTDHDGYIERKMTGSIYAVRNTWQAHVKDNEWFDYKIVVSGKTIQTFINDQLICEYTESEQPWREKDKTGRLLSSGTFALQAHDPKSIVHYKDLKVKMLKDDAPSLGQPLNNSELNQLVSKFANDNIPLIDIGSHSSENQTMARQLGFTIVDTSLADAKMHTSILLNANNTEATLSPAILKTAINKGSKVLFASGNLNSFKTSQLLEQLRLLEQTDIGWQHFWVPL